MTTAVTGSGRRVTRTINVRAVHAILTTAQSNDRPQPCTGGGDDGTRALAARARIHDRRRDACPPSD
ncbi:hypothetical protein EXIGLDRAFT_728446 [Exidia glandulosa HHB12029]|uniref:Uncharacterized protein n=1 Tax=Exidia glandulosa HHB12029 TaxID=1314781 RepID=A0A165CXD8_EXIGL|nr:hypothetical protein EXIGLDRAFT_728446 [Exidia glandulosa HHB12029]